MNRTGALVRMRQACWQEKEQSIGKAGNRPEKPKNDRNRDDRGHDHCQAGQEVGAPAGQQALIHPPTLGVSRRLLKLRSLQQCDRSAAIKSLNGCFWYLQISWLVETVKNVSMHPSNRPAYST